MFNKNKLKATDNEILVIGKYLKVQELRKKSNMFYSDHFIFMNDGFANLNKKGYPIDFDEKMYALPDKYRNFLYQANLYRKSLEFSEIDLKNKFQTIVDVGCGLGGGISFYKDFYNFKKCIGIDLTSKHIEIAKSNNFNIDFYLASATKLPIKSNSVDVITSVESVDYYDPLSKFAKESFRVLKNTGTLIISCPINYEQEQILDKFILKNKKDITNNVAIACSISKFIFLKFSLQEAQSMHKEEQRYIDGSNTKYKTYVFVKSK
jgi:ubiquinone/menaquinone biosynthesis C-methylase UbiE